MELKFVWRGELLVRYVLVSLNSNIIHKCFLTFFNVKIALCDLC